MKRMIVVSFDAVGARDLEFLQEQPNFKAFFEESCLSRQVKSIYPSVTYPAHTSILTGCYPKNHGVINNTLVQPHLPKPDWMWQKHYIKRPTLVDLVHKEGGKVACLFWPVMARSGIKWNLPEVLANRPWNNQVFASLRNGSPLYEISLLCRFGKLMDGIRQPQLDNFSFESALYTLEKYKPDLMLIHLTDVDTIRHENGLQGEEVTAALLRHDERLGRLVQKLKDLHLYEDTALVLLGDHYQKDVSVVDYPNYYLERAGFLTVKNGRIHTFDAICHEADGSAYIYVKDRDPEVTGRVKALFEMLKNQKKCGIEAIYTSEEAASFGADPTCALMLEAKDGHYFQDEALLPSQTVDAANLPNIYGKQTTHGMYATHGYHPDREGYGTFFAIRGEGIKRGVEIGPMCLVDEGPTLAKILGLTLENTDGRVLDEIFL